MILSTNLVVTILSSDVEKSHCQVESARELDDDNASQASPDVDNSHYQVDSARELDDENASQAVPDIENSHYQVHSARELNDDNASQALPDVEKSHYQVDSKRGRDNENSSQAHATLRTHSLLDSERELDDENALFTRRCERMDFVVWTVKESVGPKKFYRTQPDPSRQITRHCQSAGVTLHFDVYIFSNVSRQTRPSLSAYGSHLPLVYRHAVRTF